jgi:Flp pilus assembly protein TadD
MARMPDSRHVGEILDAADRFPDVVAVLALVRHPDYDVPVLLGRALAKVNRAAEGIRVLERAARLQPDESDAYRELGLIHLAAKDATRAVPIFEKVLQLQPRSPDVQAQLRRLRQGG